MKFETYIATLWSKRTETWRYPENRHVQLNKHLTLIYQTTLESYEVLYSDGYKPIQVIFKVLCKLYLDMLEHDEITTETYVSKMLILLSNQSNVGELTIRMGVDIAYINAVHNFAKFGFNYVLSSTTLVNALSRSRHMLSKFDSIVVDPIVTNTSYPFYKSMGN